jgi:4'-phosphopantetheinyl transferase EntD
VGVDIDDGRPLGTAAAEDLMTNEEIAVVLTQGWACDLAVAQNIVFMGKEALFKYQYPITRCRDLDFEQIRLCESESAGQLSAFCLVEDEELHAIFAQVRLFYEEIQGVPTCWALSVRERKY